MKDTILNALTRELRADVIDGAIFDADKLEALFFDEWGDEPLGDVYWDNLEEARAFIRENRDKFEVVLRD